MSTDTPTPTPGRRAGGGDAVLEVRDLTIRSGDLQLVSDVGFSLAPRERLGIIGESGSGKSLTALSTMGLLPDGLSADGTIRLAGVDEDLLSLRERDMAHIRGGRMSMVFQEPMTALNPLQRVGAQVAEVLRLHGAHGRGGDLDRAAVELLERVRLPDPAASAKAYPHQLSGGQRQRVMLAIALANDPAVLICDEPTTALDVTVQAQMLELILAGVAARESALLFITHDLAVMAEVCERVIVLYGGRIVEAGPVWDVFTRPQHRYTRGLLDASDLGSPAASGRLPTIPGAVPVAGGFPAGCVFRNRCTHELEGCASLPRWRGDDRHGHACVNPVEGTGA
jgi:peptide/nickel transport system ATP-binding protein